MKRLTLSVHLTFDDLINPKDIRKIGQNILLAIRHRIDNGEGISPDYTYTESIGVSHEGVIIIEEKLQ